MADARVQTTLEQVTRARLAECGAWHNIFRNFEGRRATSCRSAIVVRDRLGSGGNGGVPLWVELKSEIGVLVDRSSGSKLLYAAHTRANLSLDRTRIWQALALTEFTHEAATKRDEEFFGLVNPLNVDVIAHEHYGANCKIVQLFDTSLLVEEGLPATVTTNIGHHEYGMEIAAKQLIDCVRRIFTGTIVAQFSVPEDIWLGRELKHKDKAREDWQRFPPPSGPKIGMLTGNSPESGLTLWSDFLNFYRSLYNHTADVLMPETVIHSLPAMGLSMELVQRRDVVWAEMAKSITALLESGCKLICVACNTTIYFQPQIDELCKPFGARFVSIAEACVGAIKYKFGADTRGLHVGLIGIGPVIDFAGGHSGYERPFREAGIIAKGCDGSNLAFIVKNIGNDERRIQSATAKFRKLVNDCLPDESVIVLSLTELSILYRNHIETAPKKSASPEKMFIDPLSELARYLALIYVSEGLRGSLLCNIPAEFPVEEKVAEMVFGAKVD